MTNQSRVEFPGKDRATRFAFDKKSSLTTYEVPAIDSSLAGIITTVQSARANVPPLVLTSPKA